MAKGDIKGGLAGVLKDLNATYGNGTVGKTKDMESIKIEKISSGSLKIDRALGGGFAVGRIVEIYGPESSGKTTLTIHAMAEVQFNGGNVAMIDAEHAFDPEYAEALGVDIDELVICQPDNGEQALEVAESLIRSGEMDLIVIDSVSALTPKSQMEGNHGDHNVGVQAKMMSQSLMKLVSIADKAKCTVIFINQLRMKIGVMFGNPETTSGGNALKFYASQRLDVRRQKAVEAKDGEKIANPIKVKVVKNKIAPPFRMAETTIYYGEGILPEAEVLNMALEYDIIQRAGAFYKYNGNSIGQGEAKAISTLIEEPVLMNELQDLVMMELEIREEEAKSQRAKRIEAKKKRRKRLVD